MHPALSTMHLPAYLKYPFQLIVLTIYPEVWSHSHLTLNHRVFHLLTGIEKKNTAMLAILKTVPSIHFTQGYMELSVQWGVANQP